MVSGESESGDGVEPDSRVISGTKVLVATEDEATLNHLAEYLQKMGYSIEKADSSIQADSLLEEGRTDVFIIDLYLSEEDPFEIAARGKRRNPAMECIGICYMDDFRKILDSQGRGFTGVIPRPVTDARRSEMIVYNSAQRVHKEKEREHRAKEAENAMAVAAVLASQHYSFKEKLNKSLGIVLDHLDAERGSTLLVDPDSNELVTVASTQKEHVDMRKSLDEHSVATWVVRNKKPLNVDDIAQIKEFNFDKSRTYKRNSFLAYPILFEDRALGVFNVTDKKSGYFTSEDEIALTRFLERIAVVIENATLIEQIRIEREKLAMAHRELQKLEEMKDSLVSMLVHDLKNPIGEVMANLSMLSGASLGDFEKETLLMAEVGAGNLLSMVMDILDVNRMEEGKFQLKSGMVDIQDIARKKTEQMEAIVKLDNKTIELGTKGDDFTVNADEGIITRVIANLVTNAINYSPEGGAITVHLEDLGAGKVRVGVQDEGPGIPEEFQEKIFMKFSVVGEDKKRHKYSTGLGLTFCKMAVSAHGGEIWVENPPEGGSIFFFTLPK